MFHRGQLIVCVNNQEQAAHLTLGKLYTVYRVDGDNVDIFDDDKYIGSYFVQRFVAASHNDLINVKAESWIKYLNQIAALDSKFIQTLLNIRVAAKSSLIDFFNSQSEPIDGETDLISGVLQLLNGYCGRYDAGPYKGWGPITAILDPHGGVEFRRTDLLSGTEDIIQTR